MARILRTARSAAVAVVLSAIAWGAHAGAEDLRVLDAKPHHLGVAGKPEWAEFVGKAPEGPALAIDFEAVRNEGECTLLIRQADVKQTWDVKLNGRALGQLVAMDPALVLALAVPAGALRSGQNELRIGSAPAPDDIVISSVQLDARPLPKALARSWVVVRVAEAGAGGALPAKITCVDSDGSLAPIWVEPGRHFASRPGAVYTADGRARIGLPPGKYTVYASRGVEYSAASARVVLEAGQERKVDLAIRREVETPGLVSCDTHVHTLTYSGHGDATLDERAVTLAGEGIELPIATDHNHLTADLGAAAERAGTRKWFTPVVGDEVTTRKGHFNAFPFSPGEQPPDSRIEDWQALERAIRAGSKNRVIILNHPRDLHAEYRPFDPTIFNAATGDQAQGLDHGFDGIEVVNSGALQSDPMQPFRDWLALLNHGARVTAVASSDSHDVTRSIVGQGRTYIACNDADPAHIDVAAACRSLREGRALVSLGLLATIEVDDEFEPGDLARGLGESIRVDVTVQGPSWALADHVALFANGIMIREEPIHAQANSVEKAEITWTIRRPAHDAHLVVIASGPGVVAPFWPLQRPYQHSGLEWKNRNLAATNPVWLDADGDGKYTSPRALAAEVVERSGRDPERLVTLLKSYDEAVAAQAASLCASAGVDVASEAFTKALATAPEPVRKGFAAFAAANAQTKHASAKPK